MRKPWSKVEVQLLREHFADSRTDDIARVLGRPYSAVAQKAASIGLRKSDDYLASPLARRLDGLKGTGTRFQKGQQAWNKGKEYRPGGRCSETQFKPGQYNGRAAQLVVPVGSYRVNADGYLDQKVSDTPGLQSLRWKAVHRMVWEAANGPVPPGHAVVFRTGRRTTDRTGITLDALELVTRQELMRRNSYHTNYPPEVARLVQLTGAISRQINKRTKEGA